MKRIIFFGLMLMGLTETVVAQNPNWSVDASAFEFRMRFTATTNVNGAPLTNTNDQVAAFVGNELRGVGNVQYDQDDD